MPSPLAVITARWHQMAALVAGRSLLPVVLIALVAAGLAVAAPRVFALGGALEEWTRDVRLAVLTPPAPQSQQITVIRLDEDALARSPYKLPADRAQLAALIRTLAAAQVGAIGLALPLDSETEPAKDAELAAAIAAAPMPVVLAVRGATPEETAIARRFAGPHALGEAALTGEPFDGTLRFHQPLSTRPGDPAPALSFAAQLARTAGASPPEGRLRIAWRGAPTDGSGPFPSFPAHVVNVLPGDWFGGRIVLIGYDLPGIGRVDTPLNVAGLAPPIPEVMAQAHVLDQLLTGRRTDSLQLPWEMIYVLLASGAAAVLAAARVGLGLKAVAGIALFVCLFGTPFLVFAEGGPLLPVLSPLLGAVAGMSLTTAYLGRRERDQRALIRRAFVQFVPQAVVSRLERDPSRLVLGGERRELTFLFTDLEGFTTLAETADPHALSDFMHDYLDTVANAVLAEGGTIDKFLGDGVMSFFGAPEPQADAAARALAAGRTIAAAAADVTARWQARGIAAGRTRIGIHTGHALVGNFGGTRRFDYTALGDAVNVAARIEGANKLFGTALLVSETAARASGDAALRPVADIVLKGRAGALRLFEPLPLPPADGAHDDAYARAFAALETGDPTLMTALAARTPHDPLVRFHAGRIAAGEHSVRIVAAAK